MRYDRNEQIEHEHSENKKDYVEQVGQWSGVGCVHILPLLRKRHLEQVKIGRKYIGKLFNLGPIRNVKRKRKDLCVCVCGGRGSLCG